MFIYYLENENHWLKMLMFLFYCRWIKNMFILKYVLVKYFKDRNYTSLRLYKCVQHYSCCLYHRKIGVCEFFLLKTTCQNNLFLTFDEMIMLSALYQTISLDWILFVLANWNNNLRVDMSLISETLSWSRANQSYITEKQQIPIL
jgi:hypothetical protein